MELKDQGAFMHLGGIIKPKPQRPYSSKNNLRTDDSVEEDSRHAPTRVNSDVIPEEDELTRQAGKPTKNNTCEGAQQINMEINEENILSDSDTSQDFFCDDLGHVTKRNRLMKSKALVEILEHEFEKDPFWSAEFKEKLAKRLRVKHQ
jgi:hypothetical protein